MNIVDNNNIEIDRIRQNSFRMVYKSFKRINNLNEFLSEFSKFKENPSEYKYVKL